MEQSHKNNQAKVKWATACLLLASVFLVQEVQARVNTNVYSDRRFRNSRVEFPANFGFTPDANRAARGNFSHLSSRAFTGTMSGRFQFRNGVKVVEVCTTAASCYWTTAEQIAEVSPRHAECTDIPSNVARALGPLGDAASAVGRAARRTPWGRAAYNAGRGAFAMGRQAMEAMGDYVRAQRVRCMADHCERHARSSSTGYCLRYARRAAQACGMDSRNRNLTSWASTAHRPLEQQGYINLMEHPRYRDLITGAIDSDIPVGAFLQYDGTNGSRGRTVGMGNGIGHFEIKTGANQYCSDYSSSVAGGAGRISRPNQMCGGGGRSRRCLKGVWVRADILRQIGL